MAAHGRLGTLMARAPAEGAELGWQPEIVSCSLPAKAAFPFWNRASGPNHMLRYSPASIIDPDERCPVLPMRPPRRTREQRQRRHSSPALVGAILVGFRPGRLGPND